MYDYTLLAAPWPPGPNQNAFWQTDNLPYSSMALYLPQNVILDCTSWRQCFDDAVVVDHGSRKSWDWEWRICARTDDTWDAIDLVENFNLRSSRAGGREVASDVTMLYWRTSRLWVSGPMSISVSDSVTVLLGGRTDGRTEHSEWVGGWDGGRVGRHGRSDGNRSPCVCVCVWWTTL